MSETSSTFEQYITNFSPELSVRWWPPWGRAAFRPSRPKTEDHPCHLNHRTPCRLRRCHPPAAEASACHSWASEPSRPSSTAWPWLILQIYETHFKTEERWEDSTVLYTLPTSACARRANATKARKATSDLRRRLFRDP